MRRLLQSILVVSFSLIASTTPAARAWLLRAHSGDVNPR